MEAVAGAPHSRRFDLVLFQRELLSTFVTAEPLYGRPRVLDVDDAIWLHRRGSFALRLARACDAVICGNNYLADYFSAGGCKTYVLPTVVDTRRFRPKRPPDSATPIVGWSGSSSNLHLVEALDGVLAAVLKRNSGARLRIVCDREPKFHHVPEELVEWVRWSPDVEVSAVQDFNVGLMPLADTEWSRGKCAFKMLTYMACGIPVVVSPVGANAEILRQGDVGYCAQSPDEWIDTTSTLLRERKVAETLGHNGRALVESNYSVSALTPRFASILKEVVAA